MTDIEEMLLENQVTIMCALLVMLEPVAQDDATVIVVEKLKFCARVTEDLIEEQGGE